MISESEAVRMIARFVLHLEEHDPYLSKEEKRGLSDLAFAESPAEQPAPVQSGVCPDCGWRFSAQEGVYAGHLCPRCWTPLAPEHPAHPEPPKCPNCGSADTAANPRGRDLWCKDCRAYFVKPAQPEPPKVVKCSDCGATYTLGVWHMCPSCKSGAYELLTKPEPSRCPKCGAPSLIGVCPNCRKPAPAPSMEERMREALKNHRTAPSPEDAIGWAARICSEVAEGKR